MNDDQLFLANAYVDGELTDDERALAEADPAVMAEVAELRALQAQLRDVEPPTDDARESAIASAMAEFTARAAPSAAAATATAAASEAAPPMAPRSGEVVPLHRRAWFRPVLTAAAAAVGVGFFAVVLARAGGDDDFDTAAVEPAEELADEPADEPADEAFGEFETSADDAAGDLATAEPADEPAAAVAEADEAMADDDMAEEPAEEPADEPAEESADEPAEESADEPEESGEAPANEGIPIDLTLITGGSPDNPIVFEDELVTYAIAVIRNRDLGALPPSPNHACADALNVVAGGFAEFDGRVVEALIDIAPDDSTVLAWTGDSAPIPCAAIFQGIIPTSTG